METFAPLTTRRLILRNLEDTDAESFYAYRCLPEVCRFQSFRPVGMGDAHAFIASLAPHPGVEGTWFQFAVCLKESGALIGDAGVHFIDHISAEIGFTLDPRFQGQGYAHEAVEAAVSYLFHQHKKERIFAVVDRANAASVRLLIKLGMTKAAQEALSAQTDANEETYALSAEAFGARHHF